MTYLELYEKTSWDLAHNNITVGEYDERVKPLHQEITSAIEELEKIKAKIMEKDIDCLYDEDYAYSYGLHETIQIIDERISELKGENNV